MSFVLFITNQLTGQLEVVNRVFISEQEAYSFAKQNGLIVHQIVSEQQYQGMVQQQQQEKYLRQYQRPQPQYQQYPREQILIEQEPEEPEPLPQPRPPRTVGIIFKPRFASNLRFNPLFVGRRKVR